MWIPITVTNANTKKKILGLMDAMPRNSIFMNKNIGFREYLNVPFVISLPGFFVSIPMRHEFSKLINAEINIANPAEIRTTPAILKAE